MPWLEMSRDADHGGRGWEFGTCLWSPTERKGGGRWGYWDLMQRVERGDVVFHLRGKAKPQFVGHSIADADCYKTTERPPKPGAWDHAESFYRIPLRDYCPLESPVKLADVFRNHAAALIEYHKNHSPAGSPNGRFLFFVSQAGRLQCQNGAYLSEVDAELTKLIFGGPVSEYSGESQVVTGTGLTTLHTRIGQQEFSRAVRDNYAGTCCFPYCKVSDRQFLVGAHIARWSDSPQFRGSVENGLCFCLMHDKAFEIGLYTLDADFRITPTPEATESEWAVRKILPYAGQQIRLGRVLPGVEPLQHHWKRIDFSPGGPT